MKQAKMFATENEMKKSDDAWRWRRNCKLSAWAGILIDFFLEIDE